MCQFSNPLCLATPDCLQRNELCSHTDCDCAGQDKASGSLLIYATRRNERDLRQGSMQRFDVLVAADRRARKDLDEVGTCPPCGSNFRGCQRARYNYDALLYRKFDNRKV